MAKLGTSDRLMVEWWVTNRRVEERIFGTRADLTLSHYLDANTPVINPSRLSDDGIMLPADQFSLPQGALGLVEIPTRYTALEADNPQLALTWRMHIRRVFEETLGRGFFITDFLTEDYEGRERSFYLLSYNGPQTESFSVN